MVLKDFLLKDKIALVTGAGRGIGRGIALGLAEAGAHIVAVARTREEIEETAKEVRLLGREALALPTDVTRAEQVEALVEKALSHFGRLDILVNNAGSVLTKALVPLPGYKPPGSEKIPGFFERLSEEEWHWLMDTNMTSILLCCRAVGPHMLERKKGKVINLSSMWAFKGVSLFAHYCATKAAVTTFTRALAVEWAPFNINVNAIAPGYFPTPLTTSYYEDPRRKEEIMRNIPLKRTGKPRDAGLLAVYLASEASNYMTGQTINLDGGALI